MTGSEHSRAGTIEDSIQLHDREISETDSMFTELCETWYGTLGHTRGSTFTLTSQTSNAQRNATCATSIGNPTAARTVAFATSIGTLGVTRLAAAPARRSLCASYLRCFGGAALTKPPLPVWPSARAVLAVVWVAAAGLRFV